MPFFLDERKVGTVHLPLHRGKARVSCTVFEQWREILFVALSCGNTQMRKVTRRLGLSQEDAHHVESTLKTSLGIANLTKLVGSIKAGVSSVVRLEHVTEVEQTFKFLSPRCGRQSTQVFQLTRRYDWTYQDARFWHRDYWKHSITEWCDRIHDDSKRSAYDPACDCKGPRDPEPDGVSYLKTNGVTVLVGLDRVTGTFWTPVQGMGPVSPRPEGPTKVPTDAFPDYLQFLAGIEAPLLEVELLTGPQLAQLVFADAMSDRKAPFEATLLASEAVGWALEHGVDLIEESLVVAPAPQPSASMTARSKG